MTYVALEGRMLVCKPEEGDLVSVLRRKLKYNIKIALKKKCDKGYRMDLRGSV